MATTLENIQDQRDDAELIYQEIQNLKEEIDAKLRELRSCKHVADEIFVKLVDYIEFSKEDDEEVEDDDEYQEAEALLGEIDNWIDRAQA